MTKNLRDRIENLKTKKIKAFCGAALMFMGIAGAPKAEAQTDDNKDKNLKTELTLGYNNFSGLQVNSDGTAFLNDFSPSVSGSIKSDNGFYGSANVQELIILKANSAMGPADLTAINASCLAEVGKYFGKDAQLAVFASAGRSATEFFPNFLQTPSLTYANESYGGPLFNLSDKAVLGIKNKDGSSIEFGMIGKTEDGFMVIPNPKHADLWAKICKNLEAGGVQISLVGAAQGRDGKLSKAFGTASVITPNKKAEMTIGGNYDFEQKNTNALVRVAYNFLESGVTIIGQATKTGETLYIDAGVSKNGTQVFVGGQKTKDEPANVHIGVSHSFGGKKTR